MSVKILAEYIWLCGANTHHDIRGKVRFLNVEAAPQPAVLNKDVAALRAVFPEWSFDGSSTGQAKGLNTEIIVRAVRAFRHPYPSSTTFSSYVVLCECFDPTGVQPTSDNTRTIADKVFKQALGEEPWFAFEQEYVIMDRKTGRPYQWPENGFPAPQGPYYCSYGPTAWGREFAEEHAAKCTEMGVTISGLNAEVLPSQWEYQVGPCTGIEAGDHAVVARWVMLRVLERHGLDASFHSKPVKGDWNGSGMHTNFSTTSTRVAGTGLAAIELYAQNLSTSHFRDVAVYGDDNDQRLSGHHETSSWKTFAFGYGTRHTSLRIPMQCKNAGSGYFEDRRPSASADPYLVSSRLFASALKLATAELDAACEARRPAWQAAAAAAASSVSSSA